MRHVITAILLLASTVALDAQSIDVLDLRTGWSSDHVLDVLDGAYAVADTVEASEPGRILIRLAPVPLAGIEGFLVLHVTPGDTVSDIYWSREEAGSYNRSDALDRYTGWSAWREPTEDQIGTMRAAAERRYGSAKYGELVPMGASKPYDPSVVMREYVWRGDDTVFELRTREGSTVWHLW